MESTRDYFDDESIFTATRPVPTAAEAHMFAMIKTSRFAEPRRAIADIDADSPVIRISDTFAVALAKIHTSLQ